MATRSPDYHKQLAKEGYAYWARSVRVDRKTARRRDKQLAFVDYELERDADIEILRHMEIDEAIYCHEYGPCEKCKASQEELPEDAQA